MAKTRRIVAAAVIVIALSVASFLLFRYWYQPTYVFVSTDNARIEGTRVHVVADSRGEVVRLPHDTGDRVERLDRIATIRITNASFGLPSDTAHTKYIYQDLLAPISGVVISRDVEIGDTVAPGQSVVSLVNPDDIWVIANVDEKSVDRVHAGQRVDVHVDATDEVLSGIVEFIVPTTTSIVQKPPGTDLVVESNSQDVPVKVRLDGNKGGRPLYPGLSVEVRIYTK